jgi:hypothetical protein
MSSFEPALEIANFVSRLETPGYSWRPGIPTTSYEIFRAMNEKGTNSR